MKRRIFLCILICSMLTIPVQAEPIRWVAFNVPYESLKYAMNVDIETFDHILGVMSNELMPECERV